MMRGWPSVDPAASPLPRRRSTSRPDCGRYPHELPVPWLTGPARAAYDLHVEIEQVLGRDAAPRPGDGGLYGLEPRHPERDVLGERPAAGHQGAAGLVRAAGLGERLRRRHGAGVLRAARRRWTTTSTARSGSASATCPSSHTAAVADLLRRQLDRDPPTQIHGAEDGEHPPTIGLDLDEVHAAGTPIPVARRAARGHRRPAPAQPVWARLRPLDRPGRVDARLSWDPDRRRVRRRVPGQPPGLYEVRVTARDVPDAGDLDAHDVVAVVEGD